MMQHSDAYGDGGEEDREIYLLDTLLFASDARESARKTESAVLLMLADALVRRAREELAEKPLIASDWLLV